MPTAMVVDPALGGLVLRKAEELHRGRVPRVLAAVNVRRRDREAQLGRKAREVEAEDVVPLEGEGVGRQRVVLEGVGAVPQAPVLVVVVGGGFDAPLCGAGGRGRGRSCGDGSELGACGAGFFAQIAARALVDGPGFGRDGAAEVVEGGQGHAAADEEGAFEGEWGLGLVARVVEDEGGDEGAALGEADEAVIWALTIQEGAQPFVGAFDGVRCGPAPEGVVGRLEEDIDSGGRRGVERGVDEVEDVSLWVEFMAEGS